MRPLSRILLSTTLLCGALPSLALAAPQDGNVAAGAAQISANGGTTLIQQSTDRAAIDWRSFDVKANETVVFQQPSSTSVTLNRIHDQKPSEILGSISANGQVILSNPSGMIFGKDSRVDVAGLVATTAGISSEAFMNNSVLGLGESGKSGAKIINYGTITAKEAGLIALIGPQVENQGVIGARLGSVQLAGADTATVDLYGDGLLSIAIDRDTANIAVTNAGMLRARAGEVVLTAAQAEHVISSTVNSSGVIDVGAARRDANGEVVFGDGVGGGVEITGGNINLDAKARIYASGPHGGGKVHIGGGFQGGGPLPWANTVEMHSGARIAANATKKGEGGEVVLWSKDATSFNGAINARGGVKGGNGGLIETSSVGNLGVAGDANASSPLGNNGEWLLDPRNVIVSNAGAYSVNSGGEVVDPGTDDFTILDTSISTALTNGNNVSITTGTTGAQAGNITLASVNILKNGGADATLTFKAAGSITSTGTSSITSNVGSLNTIFWADAEAAPNSDGYISLTNLNISTNGGYAVLGGGLDDGTDIISAADGATVLYNGIAADGRPDGYAWGNVTSDEGITLSNVDLLTGAGSITMRGHGRNAATGNQNGVYILNTSLIRSDSNSILIDGKGGNAGTTNPGINISDANTIIRSTTGSITLNGGGGDSTGDFNYGVFLQSGAMIDSDGTAGTAAPITFLGKGGTAGASNNNYGVSIFTGSTISSRDGDITMTAVGGSGATVNNGFRLNNSTISANGDANISITGQRGDNGAGDFDIGGGTIAIGGVNATGTISFIGNTINTFANTTAQTQNNIIFKPRVAATTVGVSGGTCGGACSLQLTDAVLTQLNPDVDGNGTGSLIIGDSTAAAAQVDINGWDISGKTYDVEVYGSLVDFTGGITWNGPNDLLFHSRTNNLVIDQDFTRSAGTAGTGKLTLKASGNITSSGTRTISAANPVNTILWSNSDNAGGGFINLISTAFTTGGGYFVAGGGLDDGADVTDVLGATIINGTVNDGIPDGAAAGNAGNNTGVEYDNVDINSGNGYIQMVGQARNNAGGSGQKGISIINDSRIESAAGNIVLSGTGGTGTGTNYGFNLEDAGTAITSSSGNITINGRSNGSATFNYGVDIRNAPQITTGNNGNITITGRGADGTTENRGFHITGIGSKIEVLDGDISITGIGGNGASTGNKGIVVASGSLISSTGTGAGAGTITLNGTGGTGTGNAWGFDISGAAGTAIQSARGAIQITGVGGTGGTGNHGIHLDSTATIGMAGSAPITLTGTRGDTNAATYDIYMATGPVVIGDANATGNITLIGNSLSLTSTNIYTQNDLIIKPRTEPTTIGISGGTCGGTCDLNITDAILAMLNPDVDGNGTGSLIIGDSTDATGTVDVAGWDISGKTYDVEVHGGLVDFTTAGVTWNRDNNFLFNSRANSMVIDQDFARNAGTAGDGTLTFKASGDISSSVAHSITAASGATSGKLHTIFWSDAEAAPNSNGMISLANLNISTNGGDVVLGGGLDDGSDIISSTDGITVLYNGIAADGRPDGQSWGNATVDEGIDLNNVDLLTGTGNIIMRGRGRNAATGTQIGVQISNTSLIETGTGTLLIDGKGGNAGPDNSGILITDLNTLVRSTGGNITLNGTGGDGSTSDNHGVRIVSSANVSSLNTATINIYGKGGSAGTFSYGTFLSDATISSPDGDISITGVGSVGSNNHGIRISNSTISSNGDADITLSGTRGTGGNDFRVQGGATVIGGASATGTISILADVIGTFTNASVQTQNNIRILPHTAGTSIGISGGTCGAACTLQLSDPILATLSADVDGNGTGSLIIGDSSDATGVIDINGWNLSGTNYDVEVFGGTVDFTGAMAWNGFNDLTFNSRTGGLDIDQTFTKSGGTASGLRFNAAGAITQTSAITSSSGAINLVYDSDRDSAGAETVTLSSSSTTLGGTIDVNDNAVLGANVALSSGAGDITFVGTLNGAHNLGITTTSDIVFGGTVGGGTRLAAVTVTGGDTVVASNFNAASYTQTGGTGAVSFANGGLNTTGNTDITTTGAILGTYAGANGKLYSSGAVNATVTFNALDINGSSATLLAGNIGAPGAADQTMANLISINGVAAPTLVANPAYTFAGYTIGALAAPPAGGGGSSGSGGSPTPPPSGGGTTPPPSGGGGSSGGGSGGGSPIGSITPSFRQALIDIISAQDTVGSNPSFGFDETYEDGYYGAGSDYASEGDYSHLNERDLEEELDERNLATSKEEKKRSFKRKKLYRMSPALWRMLHNE